PDKVEPGVCGCGFPDVDTDGDGTMDCVDECPDDPSAQVGVLGYLDTDRDGYGGGLERVFCGDAEPHALVGGDCHDYNPFIHPGALEFPGDGVDQNCDGLEACFVDADGDGEWLSRANGHEPRVLVYLGAGVSHGKRW